jgi:RNA polymerase primary sigma factor
MNEDILNEELDVDEPSDQPDDFIDPVPGAIETTLEPDDDDDDEPVAKAVEAQHFDDAIKLYLRDIQKTKLLTADEEKALASRIAKGEKKARDLMIESNLRLVVKIAKRYINRGLPFLDLIEEGNMGLIKAVERFELSKECRFSTYATWWIRQSIERALVNQSRTIRLPVHVSDDINKMLRITRELTQKLNYEPSAKEVATVMGTNPMYVRKLHVLLKKTYSIERPMGENNDYFLIDTIEDTSTVAPSTHLEEVDKFDLVSQLMAKLTDSERRILTQRFGLDDADPQTLDTIGHSFGVTRERIRQIEAKSLEKLRRNIDEIEANGRTPHS